MGFETIIQGHCSSCSLIWTISLWDLKPFDLTQLLGVAVFELFPYGIWNSEHNIAINEVKEIWTISLWDLKHAKYTQFTNDAYIWTISLWDLKPNK